MDKNVGGAVAAVVLFVVVFAVKQSFFKVDEAAAKKAAEEAQKKQADERANRLAGLDPPYDLSDPKEDFTVTFPAKPSAQDIILVGLNGGHDKDWDLSWRDDARYSVHRRSTASRVDDERAFVNSARTRKIDHEHRLKKGTPEDWVIGGQQDLTFQGEYPAAEFTYTYKKYTHQEPRSGRVVIVKVPGDLFYLQVDGPPDVVAAPVTERFFNSFRYAKKPKPPANLPKQP